MPSHYEAYLERVMPQWKQPSAITYKPTYSSSVQQSSVPNSFRSSYTSRLTSSSSDWRYPDVGSGEDTTENNRFLNFIRERKPFLKSRNTPISFGEEVKKEPTPTLSFEKKPKVYFEVSKPEEEIPQEKPIVQIIPQVEKIVIDDYAKEIETVADPIPSIERFKEINQEIECLSEKDETERQKRDVEYVLSDEEVQPEPYQREPESPTPSRREISVGKLAPDITKKFEAPVTYPKSPIRIPHPITQDEDDVSPITKKSVMEHQKSIDKLKAALSVEEDIENEKREETADQHQQMPFEEETDVTESSSEVWHQPVKQEDWMQEQQNIIPSDVEEIENQFAEIVNNPTEQTYNPEEPYYQDQQETPIDYNEEQYPESYYEQPQPHYSANTNLVSNVILEEDEYEEQQEYNQEQKQEYDPNYQYQENPEYQQEYQENEQYQQQYQENEQYQQQYQENEQYQQHQDGEPYQENQQYEQNEQQQQYQESYQDNQQYQDNEQYQQPYQDNFYDENQQPAYNYEENNQQYDQNYEYQQSEQEQEQFQNFPQEYQQNYDQDQYQNYDENQTNYQEQQYVQESEYNQNYEQENQQQQEQGENCSEQLEQENYQEEPTTTTTQPKQSNLAHLLESDSESYQIEHGEVTGNNEDSDFDFSLSQKQ